MTVSQLIRKLEKMPQDEMVIIRNDNTKANGEYKVTSLSFDCSTVEICSDYKEKYIR